MASKDKLLQKIRRQKIEIIILPILMKPRSKVDSQVDYKNIDDSFYDNKSICIEENEGVKYVIQNFTIIKSKNTRIFYFENKNEAENSIKRIRDTDEIHNFLKRSKIDNKEMYLKIVKKYDEKLDKVINSMIDEIDDIEEDTCENWVSELFGVLEKFFINKLMISIYRQLKSSSQNSILSNEYKSFLQDINKYLSSNGIYTYEIYPNNNLEKDDYNYIELVTSKTNIKDEDNLITEVEKLPYLLDYKDEYGELETISSQGKVYALSLKK